jgi:hypothetical protein
MKKKQQERIAESLSKALAPPEKRRPSPALNGILAQYAPPAESGTSTTTTSTPTTTGSATSQTSIAPVRDFSKVANSITREAVPAGLFSGKGKQIYDYLYSRTRGAIVPKRSARIPFKDIMQGAHIGSEITLRNNLDRLQKVGLIVCQRIAGEHLGNEYTVYLPEEIMSGTSTSSTSSGTNTSQNLVGVVGVETTGTSTSSSQYGTMTSGESKTSIKTKDRSDDAAFAQMLAKLQQANREATGREATAAESARWGELADLLIAELKIAAARTGSVSSVPAFLSEHLRRRLWKKDKAQLERESREVASEPAPPVDASKCQDCGGSGWWYPEGTEKGVAKCRHAKLSSS